MSNAIQRLIDNGLTVQNRGEKYRIFRGLLNDEQNIGIIQDLSQIYKQDGLWVLLRWDYIPGPHYDDFWWQYKTQAEAFEAAYNYYFGSPTLIDDWLIPFHSHPELNVGQVKVAIAKSVITNAKDFEAAAQERRIRLGNDWVGWPQALKWHFLTCSHQLDYKITLRLRRDMQEAFIVREE